MRQSVEGIPLKPRKGISRKEPLLRNGNNLGNSMEIEGGSLSQMSGIGSEVNLFATDALGGRTPSGAALSDDDDDFMNGDNIKKKKDDIDMVDEDQFKRALEEGDEGNRDSMGDNMTVQ